jgi:excisionase family DNA binding protein
MVGRDDLSISEAAQRLGITTEGVRKRIQRGQLAAHKVDGRWFVPGQVVGHMSRTSWDDGDSRELIQMLREEVAFLRGLVERHDEEIKRKDAIIAALAARIPNFDTSEIDGMPPPEDEKRPRWGWSRKK